MLANFNSECGKVGLQLNLMKTMFMGNGLVPDVPIALNRTNIPECSNCVYLGQELNMTNELVPKLCRRKRVVWNAFKNIEEVVKRMKNLWLQAHLFDSTVLPALTYASETWALHKQDENAIRVSQRGIKRAMVGVSHLTRVREEIRVPTSIDD